MGFSSQRYLGLFFVASALFSHDLYPAPASLSSNLSTYTGGSIASTFGVIFAQAHNGGRDHDHHQHHRKSIENPKETTCCMICQGELEISEDDKTIQNLNREEQAILYELGMEEAGEKEDGLDWLLENGDDNLQHLSPAQLTALRAPVRTHCCGTRVHNLCAMRSQLHGMTACMQRCTNAHGRVEEAVIPLPRVYENELGNQKSHAIGPSNLDPTAFLQYYTQLSQEQPSRLRRAGRSVRRGIQRCVRGICRIVRRRPAVVVGHQYYYAGSDTSVTALAGTNSETAGRDWVPFEERVAVFAPMRREALAYDEEMP